MTIEQIIIGIFPSTLTILMVICVVAKIVREFKALKKDVVDMKSFDTQKAQMDALLHENYQLKKKLNELLTKIDHIERK